MAGPKLQPYAGPHHHMVGGQQRSRYLGYDCYRYGPMNTQRIRTLLRTAAMPAHIGADIRSMMPLEFHWPTPSHEEVHRFIDALYLLDVPTVESAIRQFPDHEFMLDEWVDRALRWRASHVDPRGESSLPASSRALLEKHEEMRRGPKFPGMVVRSDRVRSIPLGDYEIVLFTVYFVDGTPALRADIYPYGRTRDKFLRLSRVYIDLEDSSYEVAEHFPGRYRGVGLDARFLQAFLDSDEAQPRRRRTLSDNERTRYRHDRLRAAEESTENARARATAKEARALHGPSAAQEEVFAPHLVPGAAH